MKKYLKKIIIDYGSISFSSNEIDSERENLSKVRVNAALAVSAFPATSVTFAVTKFEPIDSSPVGIVNST